MDQFFEQLHGWVNAINDPMWSGLVYMLLGAGLFFTITTGFVQFRLFGRSIKEMLGGRKQGDDPHGITPFQAFVTGLASRVGVGNIAGVAIAIKLGGPGAVFWMWVTALIGMSSAFVESSLAQLFKVRDYDNHHFRGGPAYYIQTALKQNWLATLFASVLILTYMGGFNLLASFNVADAFTQYSWANEWTPWIIGAILAVLMAGSIFGGTRRLTDVTGLLVPVMAIIYLGVGLVVVALNYQNIPAMFSAIFAGAFDFQAIFGGFAGSAMMYGIKRGLYSNEAGVGSAPNAAAAAVVSHPAKQGLVQMLSVYIDTIILCNATALMCLVSGIEPTKELAGAQWVQTSLHAVLGTFGPVFITVAMLLFSFTTLIGNLYYCDNALAYLNNKTMPSQGFLRGFRLYGVIIIFVGALLPMAAAWDVADIMMGGMCFLNLIACVLLSRVAIGTYHDYVAQRKAGKDPVFRAKDIGLNPDELDYWKD